MITKSSAKELKKNNPKTKRNKIRIINKLQAFCCFNRSVGVISLILTQEHQQCISIEATGEKKNQCLFKCLTMYF